MAHKMLLQISQGESLFFMASFLVIVLWFLCLAFVSCGSVLSVFLFVSACFSLF